MLVCEMARISSHLLGMGVFGMDAGAWTPFMYTFTEREKLYTLFEELTGARFTTSYTRIGGVARDVPDGWLEKVEKFVDQLPKAIGEVEKLLTRNRIFLDRTEGIGEISKEDALAYGLTGPNLGPLELIWIYAKISLTLVTNNMILMYPLVQGEIATIGILFELKRFCKAFGLSNRSLKIFLRVLGMLKTPRKFLPHPRKKL